MATWTNVLQARLDPDMQTMEYMISKKQLYYWKILNNHWKDTNYEEELQETQSEESWQQRDTEQKKQTLYIHKG